MRERALFLASMWAVAFLGCAGDSTTLEDAATGGDGGAPDGSSPLDGGFDPPDGGEDDGAILGDAGGDGGPSSVDAGDDGGVTQADAGGSDVGVADCSALDCGARGTCDDTTDPTCICETGWDGSRCQYCAGGYHFDGDDCVEDVPCEADTCNFHGLCDDTTGVPVCFVCHAGYTGSACEECASGYHQLPNGQCVQDETCEEEDPCLHADQCNDSSGAALCDCGEAYVGEGCDSCAAGYHFDQGDVCVADDSCRTTTCSGAGSCYTSSTGPACHCQEGYTGDHCELCADGYVKIEGECRVCGEVHLPMDDLYGNVWEHSCAVASEGDSPVHYLGVAIYNDYQSTSPGIGECHVDDGPFESNWLKLWMAGARPPYLVFDHPIVSLSFQYAGVYEPGTVELWADGERVSVLETPIAAFETVTLEFDEPITTLVLDANQASYQLGLDELYYLPVACAP